MIAPATLIFFFGRLQCKAFIKVSNDAGSAHFTTEFFDKLKASEFPQLGEGAPINLDFPKLCNGIRRYLIATKIAAGRFK